MIERTTLTSYLERRRAALKLRLAELRARPAARRAVAGARLAVLLALRRADATLRFTARRTFVRAVAALRRMRRGPAPVASRRAFFTVAATVPSFEPIVRATSTRGPSAALCDDAFMKRLLGLKFAALKAAALLSKREILGSRPVLTRASLLDRRHARQRR